MLKLFLTTLMSLSLFYSIEVFAELDSNKSAKIKVLVVDSTRYKGGRVYNDYLNTPEYKIHITTNVKDTLSTWKSFQPDIIFIASMRLTLTPTASLENIGHEYYYQSLLNGLSFLEKAPKDKAKIIFNSFVMDSGVRNRALKFVDLNLSEIEGFRSKKFDINLKEAIEKLLESDEPPRRNLIQEQNLSLETTKEPSRKIGVFQKCLNIFKS